MHILDLAKEIVPIVVSFVTCELLKERSSLAGGHHKPIGKKRRQLKNACEMKKEAEDNKECNNFLVHSECLNYQLELTCNIQRLVHEFFCDTFDIKEDEDFVGHEPVLMEALEEFITDPSKGLDLDLHFDVKQGMWSDWNRKAL